MGGSGGNIVRGSFASSNGGRLFQINTGAGGNGQSNNDGGNAGGLTPVGEAFFQLTSGSGGSGSSSASGGAGGSGGGVNQSTSDMAGWPVIYFAGGTGGAGGSGSGADGGDGGDFAVSGTAARSITI